MVLVFIFGVLGAAMCGAIEAKLALVGFALGALSGGLVTLRDRFNMETLALKKRLANLERALDAATPT